MVLHRLERGDGAAELLSHLGITDRGVDAVGRPADRLGGQQRARAGQRRFPRARQDVVGADAHAHPGGRARSAGSDRELSGTSTDTPCAVAFQQQHVVAGGDQQQLGEPGTQHDPGITIGGPVVDPHVAVQPDSRGDGSVDQARQQPRLLFGGAVVGDHRRRDHGRHERSRRHRAAEFFDHHDEFGQPVAGAAVLFVDVQTEPAELDQVVPERRPGLLGRIQQRSCRPSRLLRGQERARYVGEFAMVVGQCDTHQGPPRSGPRHRGRLQRVYLMSAAEGSPPAWRLLGREPLSGVQSQALAVEHRVVHDRRHQLGVLLGRPSRLGKAASLGQRGANSSGMPLVNPVANRLGAIASTRIPSDPRSRAMVRHMPAMPALAAV